jgi:hypothetical protein
LAACGSGKKDSGIATASGAKPAPAASARPSASADREEALRQFAQCMRDHGVQMNDPDPNGGGFGFGRWRWCRGGGGGLPARLQQPELPEGHRGVPVEAAQWRRPADLSPEQLDALRAFTPVHARPYGVDVPDPDPNAPGLGFARGGRIDMNNPNFQKAMDACRDKLPFGRGGPGRHRPSRPPRGVTETPKQQPPEHDLRLAH